MKQFIEHRPTYFSGFENQTYDVKDFAEVLELEFVKNFSTGKNFYSYAVSVQTEPTYKLTLMGLFNWSEEYNGCVEWWVIGCLPGFVMYETRLKNYKDLIGGHKPDCWIRKYSGCDDLLGYDRPEKSKMKVLRELGWKGEDFRGIVNTCTCGYKK